LALPTFTNYKLEVIKMSIFDNESDPKSGRTLPFEIRSEVYRLVFAEGRTKAQVLADLESKAKAAGATWSNGNTITVKASYDNVVSVLEGLFKHLPGSKEALANLARARQAKAPQAKAK